MKKTKRTGSKKAPLAGENLFRSKKFQQGYGDPYDNINGRSNQDGIDRSELNVADTHQTQIDQDFTEDYDGDEDFYGDDEENQGGNSSYTGEQQRYLGAGNWADQKYGEHQYDHRGDVGYIQRNDRDRPAPQKSTSKRSSKKR